MNVLKDPENFLIDCTNGHYDHDDHLEYDINTKNNSSNPLSYIIKVIETSNNLLESLSLEDVFNGMILDGYDHDGIIAYSIDTGNWSDTSKHTPNDFLFRNL